MWVHQHMSIGYVQGLNDMLVPFLLTFFPTWTDDGTPLDKKGKPMSQDRQDRGTDTADVDLLHLSNHFPHLRENRTEPRLLRRDHDQGLP